jgi:hypothetical protein
MRFERGEGGKQWGQKDGVAADDFSLGLLLGCAKPREFWRSGREVE